MKVDAYFPWADQCDFVAHKFGLSVTRELGMKTNLVKGMQSFINFFSIVF